MNARSAGTLLALVLIGASGPAYSGITVYRDLNAYLAAVGGSYSFITFEGGPPSAVYVPGDQFSDDMTFETCSKPGGNCWDGWDSVMWIGDAITAEPAGTAWRSVDGALNVSPDHHPTIHSIGLDVTGDTSSVSVELSIVGEYFDSVHLNGETGFFGIVSDRDFDIFSVSQSGHYEEVGPFFLHRVAVPATSGAPVVGTPTPAVPEPSAAMLLGSGVLAVLAFVRRGAAAIVARGANKDLTKNLSGAPPYDGAVLLSAGSNEVAQLQSHIAHAMQT
ncbi:hypothetical protein [Eleftheria terrae]|uniref:hypothetical protein n=1 Tax=Eleftheria terrae TaxID=1597781 RepID=UPI00263B2A59|nr:hypothetical protein [Eleftheria terrae]WKB55783.1 hypothetical protein N7L95_27220 [Eleftheria terrae]